MGFEAETWRLILTALGLLITMASGLIAVYVRAQNKSLAQDKDIQALQKENIEMKGSQDKMKSEIESQQREVKMELGAKIDALEKKFDTSTEHRDRDMKEIKDEIKSVGNKLSELSVHLQYLAPGKKTRVSRT